MNKYPLPQEVFPTAGDIYIIMPSVNFTLNTTHKTLPLSTRPKP